MSRILRLNYNLKNQDFILSNHLISVEQVEGGAFGEVSKCWNKSDQKIYAIKKIEINSE